MGREAGGSGGGTPRGSLLDSQVGPGEAMVARLVDIRGGAAPATARPSFGPVGESAVLGRLKLFLPELKAANATLEAEMAALKGKEEGKLAAEQKERERRGVVSMGLAEDDAGAKVHEAVRRHFDVEAVQEGEAYVEMNLMPVPGDFGDSDEDGESGAQQSGDEGEVGEGHGGIAPTAVPYWVRGLLSAQDNGMDVVDDDGGSSSSFEDRDVDRNEGKDEVEVRGGHGTAKRAKRALVTEVDDRNENL